MQQSYTDPATSAIQLQKTFHRILSPKRIDQLAKLTRLVIRSRCFVPSVFLEAVMLLLINGDKEFSLRSLHENYKLLMHNKGLPKMSWEPFYDFLAKKSFLPFVKAIYDELNKAAHHEKFSDSADLVEVLKTKLPNLRDVYLQDGSEVACLCEDFKGTIDNQAKIHRLLSLTTQTEVLSTITSGVASERDEIELSLLQDILLLADAGYVSNELFKDIANAGGMFLIKLKSNTALVIDSCIKYNDDGTLTDDIETTNQWDEPYCLNHKKFKDGHTYDFIVHNKNNEEFKYRVVALFNKAKGSYVYFATNIPQEALDAIQVSELYRSRWQIEISFRILKGFCTLKKISSTKKNLVKAFIYLSQIVYLLKAITGQQLQKMVGQPLSPKKVAKFLNAHLIKLFNLINSAKPIVNYLTKKVKLFARWTKESPSYINRMRGKSMQHIIDVVKQDPLTVGGSVNA